MAQPETSATGARWAGESTGGVNQGPTSEAGGCRQRTVRADQRHSIRPGWSRHRDGGGAQGSQRGRRRSSGGGAVPGQLRDLPPTANGRPPPERRGGSRTLLRRSDPHRRRRVHLPRSRLAGFRHRCAQAAARRPGTATCRAGTTTRSVHENLRALGQDYRQHPKHTRSTTRHPHTDSVRQPPYGYHQLRSTSSAESTRRRHLLPQRASYSADGDARKWQDSASRFDCIQVRRREMAHRRMDPRGLTQGYYWRSLRVRAAERRQRTEGHPSRDHRSAYSRSATLSRCGRQPLRLRQRRKP